jgi:Cdc6-like AAA superfamily ATPase
MSLTPEQAQSFADAFAKMADNMGRALLGKDRTVRLVLCCLVSEGHLLLEDVPGTGKTMLARSLANTVQGSHARIQFTPDLLPTDVTGVTVYDQNEHRFEFHPGPIFHEIVLADEINRASPKTQSALLEVIGVQFISMGLIGELTTRTVHEADWADAWKAHFPVLRVGRRIVIRPTWRRYRRSNASTSPAVASATSSVSVPGGTAATASTSARLRSMALDHWGIFHSKVVSGLVAVRGRLMSTLLPVALT